MSIIDELKLSPEDVEKSFCCFVKRRLKTGCKSERRRSRLTITPHSQRGFWRSSTRSRKSNASNTRFRTSLSILRTFADLP